MTANSHLISNSTANDGDDMCASTLDEEFEAYDCLSPEVKRLLQTSTRDVCAKSIVDSDSDPNDYVQVLRNWLTFSD